MDAEKSAPNMVGDGKLPNHYWVSVSNDYEYFHKGEAGECMVDWIGDIIPSFESKGRTIKVFDTYRAAKKYADEEVYLGMKMDGYTINRITIEDRMSGQVFERTKVFHPESARTEIEEHEDIKFTKSKVPNFK